MKIISFGTTYAFVPQNAIDLDFLVTEVARRTVGGTICGNSQEEFFALFAEQNHQLLGITRVVEFNVPDVPDVPVA